jgi:hypothetical protein
LLAIPLSESPFTTVYISPLGATALGAADAVATS